MTNSLLTFSQLLLLAVAFQLLSMSGASHQTTLSVKRQRAEKAADLFIKRFRESLDFGRAFDEMAVSDAIQRLRKAGEIRSIGLDETLAKEIGDRTAARFHAAFFNFVYLRSIHAASLRPGVFADPDRVTLPKKFRRVINNSEQLRHLYSGSVEDSPEITTQDELRKFIADLEKISALFRGHLPRNVFRSKAYLANIKQLEKERGHEFEIHAGDNYFEIGEDVEVYVVCRDLFCFSFIEENGKLKVLAHFMGD